MFVDAKRATRSWLVLHVLAPAPPQATTGQTGKPAQTYTRAGNPPAATLYLPVSSLVRAITSVRNSSTVSASFACSRSKTSQSAFRSPLLNE